MRGRCPESTGVDPPQGACSERLRGRLQRQRLIIVLVHVLKLLLRRFFRLRPTTKRANATRVKLCIDRAGRVHSHESLRDYLVLPRRLLAQPAHLELERLVFRLIVQGVDAARSTGARSVKPGNERRRGQTVRRRTFSRSLSGPAGKSSHSA